MKGHLPSPEATRIAFVYAIIAGAYILLSDWLLGVIFRETSALTQAQTYKGLGFVVVTAALLYVERARSSASKARASLALKESQERYHRLFDYAPVSLWEVDLSETRERIVQMQAAGITDVASHLEAHPNDILSTMAKTKIIEVNQRTLDLFESTDKEDLRSHLGRLAPSAHGSWMREMIGHVSSNTQEGRMEIAVRTLADHPLSLELRWAVAPMASQDFSRVLVSMVDLTRLQLAQQEFVRLNEHLEERVRERTQQLAEANEELQAFTYSVSHDLRAPLRAIDGFSQAMIEDYGDSMPSGMISFANRIRAATHRMSQLIDDLLKLSRIGQTEMHVRHVNLSTLATEIAGRLVEGDPLRQVEFEIQPDLVVMGDPHTLRIAMENLLGNAWKFTSHHDRAHIEFCTSASSDGQTVYCVRDDGAGFDMTYAERLFSAFQRLHDRNDFEGTGVGLATVQRIIRRHGGTIWAEASVEKGARFFFTLTHDLNSHQTNELDANSQTDEATSRLAATN